MDQNNTQDNWDKLLESLQNDLDAMLPLSAAEEELLAELQDLKADALVVLKNHRAGRTRRRWVNLKQQLRLREAQSAKINFWPPLVAAASILLVFAAALYYFNKNTSLATENVQTAVSKYGNELEPASNRAYLVLANGQRIALADAKDGVLTKQQDVTLIKSKDGLLTYEDSNIKDKTKQATAYNTIEIPKKGKYQVVLPDGTKVWLNAATSLKYPSSFFRLVNRKVELLSGEAYFEVAHDPAHPFIVQSPRQTVQVLGTHFNMNAYPDEPLARTTVLEGMVKVAVPWQKTLYTLKPGQQASSSSNGTQVNSVNAADALSWKDGKFSFDSETIESVMRQVARWYDVEVVYQDPVQDIKVTGSVSRFSNISKLLEKLEQTGLVTFKVTANKLTVKRAATP